MYCRSEYDRHIFSSLGLGLGSRLGLTSLFFGVAPTSRTTSLDRSRPLDGLFGPLGALLGGNSIIAASLRCNSITIASQCRNHRHIECVKMVYTV